MSSVRSALERVLNNIWYESNPLSLLLVPLSWPVRWIVARRRARAPLKGSTPEGVCVLVVGGLTAGGTGKTPVLIALGRWLIGQRYSVGVVSRGYGGRNSHEPRWVDDQDDARVVGDEPLMIRQQLSVPVVVCPDRQRAVTSLIQQNDIDIVLSDDGLRDVSRAAASTTARALVQGVLEGVWEELRGPLGLPELSVSMNEIHELPAQN